MVAGGKADVRDAALETARPLWREAKAGERESTVLEVLLPTLGAKGKDIMQGRMREWARAEKDPAAVMATKARPEVAEAAAEAAAATSAATRGQPPSRPKPIRGGSKTRGALQP